LSLEIRKRAALEKRTLTDIERAQAEALKERISNETKARDDLFKAYAERQAAFGNQFLSNSLTNAARSTAAGSSPVAERLDTTNDLLRQIVANTGGNSSSGSSSGVTIDPALIKLFNTITPHGRWGAPREGGARGHSGIDLAAPDGTPVGLAQAGTVVRSNFGKKYGNVVDVLGADGIVTRIAHLQKRLVEEGAQVAMGQLIGLTGHTGNAQGPHIHYEIRINGRAVNPTGEGLRPLHPFLGGAMPRTSGGGMWDMLSGGLGFLQSGAASSLNWLGQQASGQQQNQYLASQARDVFDKPFNALSVAELNALGKGEKRKGFFAPGTGQLAQERADLTLDEHQLGLLKEQQAALEAINHERLTEVTNVLALEAAQLRVFKLRSNDLEYVREAVQESQKARLDAEASTLTQLVAMREEDKSNFINSEEFQRSAWERAELSRRQGARQSAEEIISWQDKLAHFGEDASSRYELAWLKAIYAVRDADIAAIESQITSQVRLADATIVHGEQVRAQVLGHLAEQKTLTQAWGDGIISTYDQITNVVDRGIDKLTHGLSIVDDLLKSIVHQLLSRVFQRLLDMLFPSSTSSGAQSNSSSGGGIGGFFKNLLGGLFGGNGSNKSGVINNLTSAATSQGNLGGIPFLGAFGASSLTSGSAGGRVRGGGFGFGLPTGGTLFDAISQFSGGGGITAPQSISAQAAQQSTVATILKGAAKGAGGAGATSGLSGLLSGLAPNALALGPLLGLSWRWLRQGF
jgi:murein DD-endopeptidase MepM/ murein hydrolase activator NlpD